MDMPVQFVQQGAAAAVDRTVWIPLVTGTDYVTPWNSTPTGSPKAKKVFDGGTAANTTNAWEMEDTTNIPGVAKVELTAAEVAELGHYVVGINAGMAFGHVLVIVTEESPKTMGASSLATQHRAGKPS